MYLLNTKEWILKNVVASPLLVSIDFYSKHWKSMGTVKWLAANILQNIFCVQQRKEIHTGLKQIESE